MKEKRQVVQLTLKVSERTRSLLRQFAHEDKRGLAKQFEQIMEEEAARRLEQQTYSAT